MGSILGAHLARAGHSVTLLARGHRAEEVQREGLRIKGLAEFATSVQVLRDHSKLERAGVLIIATKTPGTASALQALRNADIGVAFSIQNGTLKNELLAESFGADRVLGALADTSGERLAGGEVLFTRNEGIFVGELTGGESTRAQGIAQALDASGLRAMATPEIVSLEWSKFCAWAGLMAVSILTRAPTWHYTCDPGAALVVARLVRETARLTRALGIELTDQTVLPVATMYAGSEQDAAAAVMRWGQNLKARAPEHRMSALQDLQAARPLEVEETLGHAVRKALEIGLRQPLLEGTYHLVAAVDRITRAAHA